MATEMIMPAAAKQYMEDTGITKVFPIFLSSVPHCLMKNVDACATQIENGKEVIQIGIIFRTSFNSSTLVTVASLHAPSFSFELPLSSTIAALSKNLYIYNLLDYPT